MQPGLDRATILLALRRLSDLLRKRGVQGEICLFGGDVEDIRFLLRHLGLGSVEEALAVVARYYPRSRMPARTQYLLEELFQEPEGRS